MDDRCKHGAQLDGAYRCPDCSDPKPQHVLSAEERLGRWIAWWESVMQPLGTGATDENMREYFASSLLELQNASRVVLKTFKQDEAQGYRSKDRQFAIAVLSKALPLLAALLFSGCSEGRTPLGPSPITVSPMASHGLPGGHVAIRSTADEGVEPVCNFSAPQALRANENSGKVDVSFDLVPGVPAYELEIARWAGSWQMFDRLMIEEPLTWYGAQQPDRFKLRLRSLTCGNQGTWSEPAFVTVDRASPMAPPQKPRPTGPPPPGGFEPKLPTATTPGICFFCHGPLDAWQP